MSQAYTFNGQTEAVLVGCTPGTFESTRQEAITLTFAGIEHDLHAGLTLSSGGRTPWYPRGTEIRNSRQVSMVSLEELEQIALNLQTPQILPEWMGANLLLSGIPHLSLLPPNTRISFPSGAALIVSAENHPCRSAGKLVGERSGCADAETLFPRAALHLRGVVAWVERPGIIRCTDAVTVDVPHQALYQP